MNLRATAVHIAVCIIIGAVVAAFTTAKWLAAALWVSAAMFMNGSFAFMEDSRRGGFDNPDGSTTPSFKKGPGGLTYALQSLAITAALAALGFYIQFA